MGINSKAVKAYQDYIAGGLFNVLDADPMMFKTMGVPNPYNYPIDFWILRLYGTRMRQMIAHGKVQGKHGLIGIPMQGIPTYHLDLLPEGMYMTGRCLLYLGPCGRIKDIDEAQVYVTRPESIQELINKMSTMPCYHCIDTKDVIRIRCKRYGHGMDSREPYIKFKIFKKIHTSITSMAYSHDIDCKGLVLEPGREPILWATYEAAYALEHKVNIIDPDRVVSDQKGWAYSLSCLVRDGFDVVPTGLRYDGIDMVKIEAYFENLARVMKLPLHWSKDDRGRIAIAATCNASDPKIIHSYTDSASILILASLYRLFRFIKIKPEQRPSAIDVKTWWKESPFHK